MAKRVAVEDQLAPIKTFLKAKGYEVVQLAPNVEADAIVVSGLDENVMGMTNITSTNSVINAEGLTPEEVVEELERRPSQPPLK